MMLLPPTVCTGISSKRHLHISRWIIPKPKMPGKHTQSQADSSRYPYKFLWRDYIGCHPQLSSIKPLMAWKDSVDIYEVEKGVLLYGTVLLLICFCIMSCLLLPVVMIVFCVSPLHCHLCMYYVIWCYSHNECLPSWWKSVQKLFS